MLSRNYETLVTREDYLYFAGIDLDAELTSRIINDVGDNPSPRFIYGIEEWCKLQCKKPPYFWDGNLTTEHQKECFKEGVLYQIQYVLRNGNISNDSGFNMSNGSIIPRAELDRIGMSSNTKSCFRSGGMLNLWRN
ncbi:MAG: hypothetical protein J6R47_03550 [Acholeplasmatales bacterium]|nr:hypothetical protein [Acholeplasmatales bacterium]